MEDQIEYLRSGYSRFRKKYFASNNNTFEHLKTGQHPKTLIIACSDSRVDPAIIMDCEPGDLFVVRNVANLVPPYEKEDTGYHGTSAALEFGVCGLNVQNIVVLGHSMCGGINSLFEKDKKIKNRGFVNKWMEIAGDVCHHESIESEEVMETKVDKCSRLAIINSLNNLLTFPWIKERVENKKLVIHGWYFGIRTGKIWFYDKKSDKFKELS